MWEFGIPLSYIAKNFGRDEDEVALLVIDQYREGKINRRPGALMGEGD